MATSSLPIVDWVVGLLGGLPVEVAPVLSLTAGILVAVGVIGVRYWHSTVYATYNLVAVMLLALSPLSTEVLALDPWVFVGGFLAVQGVGLTGDYFYRVVTGEDTGVEAFRTVAARWIDRIRDRRRTVRRRLETILDRKAIIAVLVGMPLSELVKLTVVQAAAADPIRWNLAWAHGALVIVGLGTGIYWERVTDAAREAGEQAEEIVEGDG